ncbi:ATP-dependent DNA helicase UvrD2 [Bogoriella caseilytica]|uniref:DNA 3'-5' helicase n=1 Tax=Bogoriella caseilytica TaxID=56055 RepID=A0A3N2B9W7_9MICO|nr:ATP-dependent DNA helicase UvrD2 [Bogoriella caseilytica]ROR72055.1 Rep family ATP-dependent DNA helicase [Bogoriella caseilytica]
MTSHPATEQPSTEQLLEALDPDQRAVAETLTGPVCVLAGAGTGKTRAITYRIANGVLSGAFNPQAILAVTFTARAAGEMRTRLRDLGAAGVQARTFHAAALRQLSYFWPSVIGGSPLPIAAHKAGLVASTASRLGLSTDRTAIRDLAAEVEWSKVSLITAEDYVERAGKSGREAPSGNDHATIARLLEVYEEVKTERGVIDFEDVLLLLVGILSERDDIASQVRSQYRHFVVDEYQDVSPLQQRLLDLWLGDRRELCVVGDVSQTIYSFTGATPRFLTDFPQRYAGAPVIKLVRDYRSTPQVVELANGVLARAGGDRSRAAVELIAQRPSSVPVRYETYDDDLAEARAVAERIAALQREGVPLSEIAVLYRTNGQSEVVEQALADAQIGYLVRGGERFFSRREVKEALVLLRGAVRSSAEQPMPEVVRAVLGTLGWDVNPPSARGAARERWESLNSLVSLADDLHTTRGAGMAELVAELDERASAQHAPAVEGVTLASLHAAKGLEWDAVFLIGVSEGLLPISLAEGPAAIAEERRLLYVGVTRAREHLQLSYARARAVGGRASRKPTRFLDGIWPDPDAGAARRGPSRRAAVRQRTEDYLTEHPEDAELFERLRTWRGVLAKELSKPAYTVFHDTTLQAIATAKPKDLRQLALLRGVGATKLEAYGGQVLAVVRGEDVDITQWLGREN